MRSERSTRNAPLSLRPLKPGAIRSGKSTATPVSGSENIDFDDTSARPQLAFVTTTGPPSERSPQSRYVVRSHAMQAFLQGKNSEGRARPNPSGAAEDKKIGDLKGRFKLESWSRKSKKKGNVVKVDGQLKKMDVERNAQLSRVRGSSIEISQYTQIQIIRDTLDGYSTLSMQLQAHTRKFLYYYNTSFTMNSSALNPEGTWISFAITDEAVLHSTMAIVSWHFDQIIGIPESPDTLHQKGEAIKMINARLADSSKQVDDGIVGAVAVLANFETMNGTERSSKIHMTGLRRMVQLRGGLTDFDSNKVLQRVLTWSDVLYSSTWDCKPVFPLLPDFSDPGDPISTLSRFSSIHNPTSVLLDTPWFPSRPSLLPTLESLRRISSSVTSPNLGLPDRNAISNRIYRTEHDLLSLHKSVPNSPSQDIPSNFVDLSEPFRLIALLYLRIAVRELPSPAKMHYRLVSRVRSALEATSEAIVRSFSSNHSAELLAWIAFIGCAAASDADDRRYFVGLLSAVCGAMKVDGQMQLQRRLEGICWRNGVCDGYLVSIWKEMEISRFGTVQIEEV